MNLNFLENQITSIMMLVERAEVLAEDVNESFLDRNIDSPKDFWQFGDPWRNVALVKNQCAAESAQKALELLKELSQLLDEADL